MFGGLTIFILLMNPRTRTGGDASNQGNQTQHEGQKTPTDNIGLRREWRTLSRADQQHYISSVRCLLTQPSVYASHAKQNSTMYEDFPWTHAHSGHKTHNSASFLPWHRYFLHIYEDTLRNACNFTGELVYWDWTLDWEDLAHAPVFDPVTGFGGDGDPAGPVTLGNTGRCVVDGPFSDVRASFYDVKWKPHCLSRGFRDDRGNLGRIDGKTVSPESIEQVLSIDNYERFVLKMESLVHDAIPFGISGDFETFTAPYGIAFSDSIDFGINTNLFLLDPIFFLHHTQLDRLWWIWQHRDLENRRMAYSGHRERHSMVMAVLSDKLSLGGLAPEIEVEQVMDAQTSFLRYTY